ncbi:hypothetical protein PUMCH_003374 [Australozyma saopauloensis]|uniref:C2H2-type domain-containing protein n=1 Tax=Australozyma saopauloensis TaxID=291208 RepID=A0AAX4HC72_9ASCO|nr:hypothetical protein PUMCH_003374 [[Candida] saopauloensis]
MSEKTSVDQYGRKTWNVEAYEKEAGRKRALDADSSSSNAKLLKNKTVLEQRQNLIDLSVLAVKSHTLIGADAASTLTTYGKNKRFGFFCPVCDLSFRDTLALVDHINLPQHAKKVAKVNGANSGEGELLADGVRRATVEQVAQTIEELVKRLWQQKVSSGSVESLQERVRKREKFEADRARLRAVKRKEAAEKAEPTEMGKLMGIEGFGTTKR